MTQETTNQAEAAINSVAPTYNPDKASRCLGLMMMAQAELLNSISLHTPTGLSASVTGELATHMASVGQFLATGSGAAVIHDRQFALASYLASVSAGAFALRAMNVDAAEASMESQDNGVMAIIIEASKHLEGGTLSPLYSLPEAIAPLLEKYVKPAE